MSFGTGTVAHGGRGGRCVARLRQYTSDFLTTWPELTALCQCLPDSVWKFIPSWQPVF